MLELNKIYNEDCLIGMQRIDDKSIDMILCDLPYGTTACKWDNVIPFESLWEQYNRVIKDNGAIVLFANGLFTPRLMLSNLNNYKYKWVWVKRTATNFVHSKNRPMSKYEDILIFSKSPMGHKKQLGSKRMKYNPQGLIKINKQRKASPNQFGTTAGKRPSHKKEFTQEYTNYPNDLLVGFFEEISNIKLHPTQKPVALLEYLIKTYTNENELVLDNCIGSGSTAIACINTNRNYIGFEKEKEYCEIANNRIKNQKFF